jgi:hypothetical protein
MQKLSCKAPPCPTHHSATSTDYNFTFLKLVPFQFSFSTKDVSN